MSYSWLPPLLNEIADVAGVEAALALADARGGSRISIPGKVKIDHWLVKTVGIEAANKICEYYRTARGGAVIDLPVGPSSAMNKTRQMVDRMIRDGVSADVIATKMKVHRTTVFRRKANINGNAEDTAQPSLFD